MRTLEGNQEKTIMQRVLLYRLVQQFQELLSELAVEEMAVTQALRDRLARKKSVGE